jgi:cytoskeletal protein CcmA (bactofilin family)
VAFTPYRMPGQSSPGATAVGSATKFVGQIVAKQDVYVEGEVEGQIEATERKVVVGPTGCVRGDICAAEVEIFGQMRGNVEAGSRVALRKGSDMLGDINTQRIGMEDGAVFKGRVDAKKPLHGQISPDRSRVAYTSDITGRYEVYVAPFPGEGGGRQVSTTGGLLPRWSADGKELIYAGLDAKLMSVEVTLNGGGVETGIARSVGERAKPIDSTMALPFD